jgi:hypothetical protein
MSGNLPTHAHLLEMFYHREFGYGLGDDSNTGWVFKSAFTALNAHPTDAQLKNYRDVFIQRGYGRFDGNEDPIFRISPHGEEQARISIARREPWYNLNRLQTYNWAFWAAVISTVGLIATIFLAYVSIPSVGNSL